MSASQEKKRRREERAEGVDKKTVVKNKTAKAKKRSRTIAAIVAIVLVVVVLFLVVMNSSLFYSQVPALRVGSHSFTADEYNYFYQNALYTEYNRIYQNMGEYTSYFLDLTKPLSEQTCTYDSSMTWADYIADQTMKGIRETVSLSDAAKAEGYTLTAEDQATIEENISSTKDSATSQGGSFKSYLSSAYGRGFTEANYRELVTEQVMAVSYRDVLLDRWESGYTDTLLDDKYEEIADQYDLLSYCYYFVSGEADDENGIDADTAMNAAYDTAQTIAAGKTEEVFLELVQQTLTEEEQANYADVDSVLRSNVSAQSLSSSDYYDWLVDAARAYGDTTVVEGTNGYYVLLFVGRNHNDYALRSFRHILVQVETGDEVDSGAATLAAQSEANTLYEQWQEDPTEDNFAEMANANSDDGGSNTKGGLYEDVQYGQMVKPIEDWLFDEARQPGDSTVVYASNSNYSGYHIVYYVGEEDHNYNLDLATTAQQNDDYAAWLEEKEPSYPIQKLFAFRFTK